MKKIVYRSEIDSTKAGRAFRALLALCTARKYSLIFSFKITLVRREYQPHRTKQRVLESFYIFLVLFPLMMGAMFGLQKCGFKTFVPVNVEKDSVCIAPVVPDSVKTAQ